ncbi:c-type cytochrome [Lutibacter sp. A64]|uniref:c-type cytochrome n=1 Tax=Lutibacter sp. A64 TaxID=2918526 RepID=UPI001F053B41|nr:c-type cytochrome [Lutibacter sp. A64]UMB53522.1 c-type cytochrome [Lutibacter sp. A64]
MKSVKQHSPLSRLVNSSLAFLLLFSLSLSAQQADVANGEKLFKANCAACHKLDKKLVGPALEGITEKREQDWLISWIKDSPGMIKSGDKLAIQVFEENNKLPMVANPHLSDQDIIDILEYTKGEPVVKETASVAQEVDPGVERGKQIFKTNCAACHKMEGKLIGPELLKITDTREHEWLKAWIKDNNALAASGDKLAKEVQASNPAVMTPFPQLSDQDLEDLLKYFAVGDVKEVVVATADASSEQIFNKPGFGVLPTLGVTILAFLLLSLIVAVTTNKKVEEGEEGEESTENMLKTMFFNPFLRFLTIIFVLLGGAWFFFGWLMQIDVNEGYQPIQPITFSHAVHAGDNKIDCQYCHSSAKHSKTSGIPTANVCMNCHKSISEYTGPLFDGHTKEDLDNEIQKIYDAVGWDKDKMEYIEGYEEKPIEWVRIHNLADFAYYNHSQHVTVAGLDCQKCHGPVEEMHEMHQFSPLTMGWCIDCHRETEVDMTENGYYKNIHDQLAKKYGVEKVTAAQMGGLECGKCHY